MACWKRIYDTKKEAKVKKRVEEQRFSKKLNVYKCPDCGFYHLTSKTSMRYKEFFRDKYRDQ